MNDSAAKAGQLTTKQENFCLEYIKNGNASETYRQTYNCSRMKPETINRNAKALLDNNKIATRLDQLRAPVVAESRLTLANHLAALKRLREKAVEDKNWSAAISAEVARGKASGLHIRKVEDVTNGPPVINVTFVEPDPETAKKFSYKSCANLKAGAKL